MKSKVCWWVMAAAIVALSAGAVAQNPQPDKFSGTISDYTTGAQVWEMRGTWSVKVNGNSGNADFAAELNMEHSDLGLINGATGRVPHTHHITMTDAQVISDASYVASNCPSAHYAPPTTTGFAVVGMASVTGNGAFAPFAKTGQLSQLTVCVTGASQVGFSNVTLVFPATYPDGTTPNPASTHFGTQPINGVVVRANGDQK
ncbi:MAG: hypothetical protein ACRD3E_07845 [Terriglobales bacterium]